MNHSHIVFSEILKIVTTKYALQPSYSIPPKSSAVKFWDWRLVPIAPSKIITGRSGLWSRWRNEVFNRGFGVSILSIGVMVMLDPRLLLQLFIFNPQSQSDWKAKEDNFENDNYSQFKIAQKGPKLAKLRGWQHSWIPCMERLWRTTVGPKSKLLKRPSKE